MNWVGGSRHRLKHFGEKKLQREFFERQKFALKTARRHKHSPSKKKQISQDLKEIMTINNTHSDSLLVMKPRSKPIKSMDFDKYKQRFSGRRVTEDVELDSSPIKTPSKIQLMEAKAEQKRDMYNKSCLFTVTEEDEGEEVIFGDEKILENNYGPAFIKRQTLEKEPTDRQIKISSNQSVMDYISTYQTPHYNNFHEYDFDQDSKTNVSRKMDVMSSCSMMQTWNSPDIYQNNKINVTGNILKNSSKPLKYHKDYTSPSWDTIDNHDPRNFRTPSAFCTMSQHCDLTRKNIVSYRNPEKIVLTPLKTPLLSPILNCSGEEPGEMDICDPENLLNHDMNLQESLNKRIYCSEMETMENNIKKLNTPLVIQSDSANESKSPHMHVSLNSTEAGNVSTESPLPNTVSNYNDFRDGTGEKSSLSLRNDNLYHDIERCIEEDMKDKGNLTPVSIKADKNLDQNNENYKVNNIGTQTGQDLSPISSKSVEIQLEEACTQTSQDISDVTCKEEKLTQTSLSFDLMDILCKEEKFTQTSPDICNIKIQRVEQSVQTSPDTLAKIQREEEYSTVSDAASSPFKNLIDQEPHFNQDIYISED